MKLKLRYASLLLLIFLIILLFTWLIAQSVIKGQYLVAIALAALLYGAAFFMGTKFRKVFFLLSTIKLMRRENGVVLKQKVVAHIVKRGSPDNELAEEIIELLVKEGLVEQRDDKLLLTGDFS